MSLSYFGMTDSKASHKNLMVMGRLSGANQKGQIWLNSSECVVTWVMQSKTPANPGKLL